MDHERPKLPWKVLCRTIFLRVAELARNHSSPHKADEPVVLYGDANATKGRVVFSADGLIRHPVLTDPILKARVAAPDWEESVSGVAAQFCGERLDKDGAKAASAATTLQVEVVGDYAYSGPSLTCGMANGAVIVRDPSVDQVVFGLRSISRTTAWQLHSPAELAAVVRASTHHEFSRLGAANRAFAAACGPVLGELWSAEMILQFAGAYDDCVSGREATAGPSYRC